MLTPSVRSPEAEIRFKLALPLGQVWRGFMEPRRASQVQRRDHLMTGCFGRLTDKDEMVLKGLAASLACSNEREKGPS
jgi:hypothetical protein